MPSAKPGLRRQPVIAAIDEARRFKVFDAEAVTPLISSNDVGGAYAIWLHEAAPGVSPPRHIHHREDEVFHVLEGHLRIWCDGQTYHAGPRDTAMLPKGIAHTCLVTGETAAKLMVTVSPGGLDEFFSRMASMGVDHNDLAGMMELQQDFGVEIVGPPLER